MDSLLDSQALTAAITGLFAFAGVWVSQRGIRQTLGRKNGRGSVIQIIERLEASLELTELEVRGMRKQADHDLKTLRRHIVHLSLRLDELEEAMIRGGSLKESS